MRTTVHDRDNTSPEPEEWSNAAVPDHLHPWLRRAHGGNRQSVDDPFYGFNEGSTHVRVDGDGDPLFYQFEGPMLRLMIDHDYELLVHGNQGAYLRNARERTVAPNSIWVYRFYDQAATTFAAPPHRNSSRKSSPTSINTSPLRDSTSRTRHWDSTT